MRAGWSGSERYSCLRKRTPNTEPQRAQRTQSNSVWNLRGHNVDATIAATPLVLHLSSCFSLYSPCPVPLLPFINSALPFTLFAYAMLSITAGFASILNAASPLFGALIGYLWLRDRLAPAQIVGLAIGFAGVVFWLGTKQGCVAAAPRRRSLPHLIGTVSYGLAANYTTHRLRGMSTLAIAAGSQAGQRCAMLPLAAWCWPSQLPSLKAWLAVITLGLVCTGLGYILYFRLIANIGATRAIAVTFLIPVFGMLFGVALLGENVTGGMFAGGVVILVGTALAIGLLIVAPMRVKPHDSV